MSILPDWLEIDIGTGATTVVDLLGVEVVDDTIEIEMESAILVDIISDEIELEVC